VIDMYGVKRSDRKSVIELRRALGRVWVDIIHAQRRAAELNTPWVARGRSTNRQ
jgi:hypothetical protein